MAGKTQLELATRKEPKQARARQTWEKILKACAVLLDEVGLDGINTNLIAEKAGVNISAIYKYFPNKHAVLTTLASRLNDKQTELTLDYIANLDESTSWQDMMSGMSTFSGNTNTNKAIDHFLLRSEYAVL